MIRISNGKNIPDFGNNVSYAIKEIIAGTNSYKLKYGKYEDKNLSSRSFDFENQQFINKGDSKSLDNSIKSMMSNYENSLSSFKNIKHNLSTIDQIARTGQEMCKKLSSFKNQIGEKTLLNLNKLNEDVKKTQNSNFTKNLNL